MKKVYTSLMISSIIVSVLIPTLVFAEEENGTSSDLNTIRSTMRAEYNTRLKNINANKEVRNTLLSDRMSSSTRIMNANHASTTVNENRLKQIKERLLELRNRVVLRNIQQAVNNLIQIRDRINSRIQKEKLAGRDMTSVNTILQTADLNIISAKNAVNTLISSVSTSTLLISSSTLATSTASIKIDNSLVKNAKDVIKEAKKSLSDVVVALAHALGNKIDQNENASSTGTTTKNID